MILGIIISIFIGGCVGIVIMAIMQMAREDEVEQKGENDDGSSDASDT